IATQNPIEMDGTYRLPEAQLDRFLMRIELGFPDPASERDVVLEKRFSQPERLDPVLSVNEARSMCAMVSDVHISADLADYVVALSIATRPPKVPETRL